MPAFSRVATLAIALLVAAPAQAADFFAGKQLSILVNFPPGGSTDIESRLMSRHLAKHIPGNPAVIVRNMGGASGVIGMNWLGEIAAPDGLTFGYFTGAAAKAAFGEAGVRVDLSKMVYLATGPSVLVNYVRTDTPPGIKVPADILKANPFWAVGLLPGTDKDVRMRLTLDLLGVKYRYLSNYPGSAEARLAVERNEVQMYTESVTTYRASIESTLIKSGVAIPLWVDPLDDGEKYYGAPEAEGLPIKTYPDFYREVKGEPPKSIEWDAWRHSNFLGSVLQRTLVMPPGSPKEAATILKTAIAALATDREYVEDAARTMGFSPKYLLDDKSEKVFKTVLNPEPRLKDFIAAYIEKGRASLGK